MNPNTLMLIGELLAAEGIVRHCSSLCRDFASSQQLSESALLIRQAIHNLERKSDPQLTTENEVQA